MVMFLLLKADKHSLLNHNLNISMQFIISLTTVPHRLEVSDAGDRHGCKSALLTLLNQTYGNYEVHLNVPHVYKALSQAVQLPDWLLKLESNNPRLKIFRTEDYGAATKLYPTVQRVTDSETNIIIADDDLEYCDGIIAAYEEARQRYPDDCIGYAGISEIGGKGRHFCTTVDSDARVKVIEGYKTVCFKRSFFDEHYDDFVNKTWADDVGMSAYMGYRNIRKIVLKYANDTDFRPRVESFPVIGHTVYDNKQGCNIYRRLVESNAEENQRVETIHSNWYKLGYLER